MSRKRTSLCAQDNPFAPGVYLTDGSSLFHIVGELPHEPSLRLVEDCSTLEILMVHIDGLRAPGVRRVQADPQDESRQAACQGAGDALDLSSLPTAARAHR
jgi:hypothetical protein